jgi:GNAT superfamily N-acetyltransferase
MPTFELIRSSAPSTSFRVAQVRAAFTLDAPVIQEQFAGELPIEGKPWSVGLIYGGSGTGKSTISRELFGAPFTPSYSADSVIDDFPAGMPMADVTAVLGAVGFGSVPSWLKPYRVLSTGEQMRVDLARALVTNASPIVFDEFTSVVDREVAKFASKAVARAVRKHGKRFVAVACHSDIIPWLCPDWSFCTDDMSFTWRSDRQPRIELDIHLEKGRWGMFGKHHYLSHTLHPACAQFVAYFNDAPIAFYAVLPFPHPKLRNVRKCHRLVVLPTYQGNGVARALENRVASWYAGEGYDFRTSSSQAFWARSFAKDTANWTQTGGASQNAKSTTSTVGAGGTATDRTLYSFKYIGPRRTCAHPLS